MGKAIIAKFECPSCGNVLTKKDVIKTQPSVSKFIFEGPKRCPCGRRAAFSLLTFEAATATITSDKELEEKKHE